MNKVELINICRKIIDSENNEKNGILRSNVSDFLNVKVNEFNVILDTQEHVAIDHKAFNLTVRYIQTPFGFVVASSYTASASDFHQGSSGPVHLCSIAGGDFHSSIQDYAREVANSRLLAFQKQKAPEVILGLLGNYLKSTEQMTLFDMAVA